MAIKYLSKPFFLSVLLCIIIFYSGIVKIPDRHPFSALIPKEKVTRIYGSIYSTPAKCNNGKYYKSVLEVKNCGSSEVKKSSAWGRTTIYIPTEMIESYFPGKLFSQALKKGAFLYEAGGIYNFEGEFFRDGFYITSCDYFFWPKNLFGKIDYFRALCRLHFKRLMYAWGEAGGLLLALLSGAREYTSAETSQAFTNAGLSHILALSGMHLSMFSSIAMFIGSLAGHKKLTYIIRIIALILFVWFAGLSPSLLRAFICAGLSLLTAMNGTSKPDFILILCFSFLAQSIISPSDIQNIGFIMSYGALAGILLTSNFFRFILSKITPNFLSNSLSASCGAQILTAPVSLKVFGTFCPIGIVATSVISPFVTIFIYSGLAFIIISLIFPILQAPSGFFINLQYTIIKYLVIIFSKVPKIEI